MGALHGGANEAVLTCWKKLAALITFPSTQTCQGQGRPFRIMGFGHRVYKNYDPRAKVMQQTCHEVLEELVCKMTPYWQWRENSSALRWRTSTLLKNVCIRMWTSIRASSKSHWYSSEMFTVIFATGRTPGWIAHWCEMIGSSYKIGRPRQLYTGSAKRTSSK